MNSRSVPRIHYEIIIFSMDSLWSHYLFCEFTMHLPREILWIHYQFNEFTINFANSLLIQFLFRELTINSLLFRGFTINFVKIPFRKLWIFYLFHEFTMNSYDVWRIKYEFTISIANLLWMREYIMNSLWVFYFWTDSLWIHYLLRASTIKILSFREFTIINFQFHE